MANLVEIKADLFNSPLLKYSNCMILHCVSSDYALGVEFALEIEKRYRVRDRLKLYGTYNYPDCLAVEKVINLVTKSAYWNKPTYEDFNAALYLVRDYCISHGINILVVPRIGCGLDKLSWKVCKGATQFILVDSNIDCSIYRIK